MSDERIMKNRESVQSDASSTFENFLGDFIDDPSTNDPNYQKLLENFKKSLMLNQPSDVYSFCSSYFKNMLFLQKTNANSHRMGKRTSVFGESVKPTDLRNLKISSEKEAYVADLIKSAFFSIPVLSHMDMEAQNKMVLAFKKRSVSADEDIIKQGEEGDYFYVIEKGHFQIEKEMEASSERVIINVLKDEGYFGEIALLYNKPRNATVRCITKTGGILWEIDRLTFKTILVSQDYSQRKVKTDFLKSIYLFSEFSDKQIDSLSDALFPVIINQVGKRIIKQGDKADALYIIESGEVVFEKIDANNNTIEIGKAGEGEYFGEMALINHAPRAATVKTASTSVKLLKLDVQDFDRLLGLCHPKLQSKIASYN